MTMLKLPEGFTLPAGVRVEDLAPDPGKRFGCYLDTRTDTTYALGVKLEIDTEAPAKPGASKATPFKVDFAEFKEAHAGLQPGVFEVSVKVGPDAIIGGWGIDDFWQDNFKVSEPKCITDNSVRLAPVYREAILKAIRGKRAEMVDARRKGV